MFFGESVSHILFLQGLLLLLLLGAEPSKGQGLQKTMKYKFMKLWEENWKGTGNTEALDSALLNSWSRFCSTTPSSSPDSGKVVYLFIYIYIYSDKQGQR